MNNKSHAMFRHSKIGYAGVEAPVQLGGGVGLVEILGVAGTVTPILSASPSLSLS
jgi:hypothetical protein